MNGAWGEFSEGKFSGCQITACHISDRFCRDMHHKGAMRVRATHGEQKLRGVGPFSSDQNAAITYRSRRLNLKGLEIL